MKYDNVKYGILLTKEQLDFLKDDHQGFHRMKAFDTFFSLAAIEPFHYEKKNFSADLGIGQFAISKVELAELWHCDRKTAQKMIDLFNEVGILTSVANDCMDILKSLPRFDWTDYEALLTKRGYKVKMQRDKENVVRGYSVKKGYSSYKSSELGTGRNLMPTKIEDTWQKLHPVQKPMAVQALKPLDSKKPVTNRPSTAQTSFSQAKTFATSNDYKQVFLIDDKQVQLSIPERVYKELDRNIEVPDNSDATHEDILKVAMLLFLEYVDAATSMSESIGGGGGPGIGWGKDKDEDELEWARRCAIKANWLCKPMVRRWKRSK